MPVVHVLFQFRSCPGLPPDGASGAEQVIAPVRAGRLHQPIVLMPWPKHPRRGVSLMLFCRNARSTIWGHFVDISPQKLGIF